MVHFIDVKVNDKFKESRYRIGEVQVNFVSFHSETFSSLHNLLVLNLSRIWIFLAFWSVCVLESVL